MPVKFIARTLLINSAKRVLKIGGRVIFGSKVVTAEIAVSGFKLFYDDGDHEILALQVFADIDAILGKSVLFNVICHLADRSVNKPFSGKVRVLIIAEVEAVGTVLQKRTRSSSSPRLKRKNSTGGRRRSKKVARGRKSR
jgi:hypothetical protein